MDEPCRHVKLLWYARSWRTVPIQRIEATVRTKALTKKIQVLLGIMSQPGTVFVIVKPPTLDGLTCQFGSIAHFLYLDTGMRFKIFSGDRPFPRRVERAGHEQWNRHLIALVQFARVIPNSE